MGRRTAVPRAPDPRLVLAEEHEWGATQGPSSGWCGDDIKRPPWLDELDRRLGVLDESEERTELRPRRIAAIYRALRKGREDEKDEPGAADFYYGEMEMRRPDPTRTRAERAILWLYWLVSGYGLRATRALASLFVTLQCPRHVEPLPRPRGAARLTDRVRRGTPDRLVSARSSVSRTRTLVTARTREALTA
jgi:hypothetical protein